MCAAVSASGYACRLSSPCAAHNLIKPSLPVPLARLNSSRLGKNLSCLCVLQVLQMHKEGVDISKMLEEPQRRMLLRKALDKKLNDGKGAFDCWTVLICLNACDLVGVVAYVRVCVFSRAFGGLHAELANRWAAQACCSNKPATSFRVGWGTMASPVQRVQ